MLIQWAYGRLNHSDSTAHKNTCLHPPPYQAHPRTIQIQPLPFPTLPQPHFTLTLPTVNRSPPALHPCPPCKPCFHPQKPFPPIPKTYHSSASLPQPPCSKSHRHTISSGEGTPLSFTPIPPSGPLPTTRLLFHCPPTLPCKTPPFNTYLLPFTHLYNLPSVLPPHSSTPFTLPLNNSSASLPPTRTFALKSCPLSNQLKHCLQPSKGPTPWV